MAQRGSHPSFVTVLVVTLVVGTAYMTTQTTATITCYNCGPCNESAPLTTVKTIECDPEVTHCAKTYYKVNEWVSVSRDCYRWTGTEGCLNGQPNIGETAQSCLDLCDSNNCNSAPPAKIGSQRNVVVSIVAASLAYVFATNF